MRILKFRGMDINGNWYYGNLAILKKKISKVVNAGYYISNAVGMPFAYVVRPETVGQNTGLNDKNGNEIYEGDIIRLSNGEIFYIYRDKYTRFNFCLAKNKRNRGYKKIYDSCFNDISQIIGNIYENYELLSDAG